MRGVYISFLVVAVAAVAHGQFFRDITIPPQTCPPCNCNNPTTTTRPPVTTSKPCETPPTRPPVLCPPCVMSRCTPNACDQAVQVPFPGDCKKFCKCEHNGAQEFDCPGGLHFNEVLQLCDWPENAGCTVANTFLPDCTHLRP